MDLQPAIGTGMERCGAERSLPAWASSAMLQRLGQHGRGANTQQAFRGTAPRVLH